MNKRNQILALILVIQIVIGLLLFWPWAGATEASSGPLFVDFEADQVQTLTISDGEGNSLTLAKKDGGWVLPQADDFPVDGEKVSPLLEKIGQVQTNRLVTQTEASHKRLQVAADEFNRLVEMSLAGDGSHRLYIGSSAGAGATHVRADMEEEVYLAGELNSWEANPQASAWIDPLYFTLPQTATVALTLENQNGTFEFEKEGEGWRMKGLAGDEVLDESTVTTLVNTAGSVQMTEPIGRELQAEFGLEEPQATVTLETEEETYTLRLGPQDPENNSYILKASNSPYYVRVAAFTGDAFAGKTRADFLSAPPTAEPVSAEPE